MSRKKKVKLFLVGAVVLYFVAVSFGLNRDDGAMGEAMRQVNELVADTRREIQKEMDKPFILRLFGSLFGMENNSFDKMKKRLPEIFKSAMPDVLDSFSFTAPTTGIACEGMRLADALSYLQDEQVPLETLQWSWDPEVQDDIYIQLSGVVLSAEKSESGGAILVLQFYHPYNGEDGIGSDPEQRTSRLDDLETQVEAQRLAPTLLDNWFTYEDADKLATATDKGFPFEQWRGRALEFIERDG